MKKALIIIICIVTIFLLTSCGDGRSGGSNLVSPVGPGAEIPLDYSTLQIHKIGITQSLSNNEVSLYVDVENTGFQNLTSMVARFMGEPFWNNELFNLAAKERKIVTAAYGTNRGDMSTYEYILKVYILRRSNLDTSDSLAYKDGRIYYEAVP